MISDIDLRLNDVGLRLWSSTCNNCSGIDNIDLGVNNDIN